MNESNTLKLISEAQFKRICGEVWADSLSNFDVPLTMSPVASNDAKVLGRVLELVRRHLDIDAKTSMPESTSLDCRNEIDDLIRIHRAAPFDHTRIMERLLRELQKEQVV